MFGGATMGMLAEQAQERAIRDGKTDAVEHDLPLKRDGNVSALDHCAVSL